MNITNKGPSLIFSLKESHQKTELKFRIYYKSIFQAMKNDYIEIIVTGNFE